MDRHHNKALRFITILYNYNACAHIGDDNRIVSAMIGDKYHYMCRHICPQGVKCIKNSGGLWEIVVSNEARGYHKLVDIPLYICVALRMAQHPNLFRRL